jgi:hypothetical protein
MILSRRIAAVLLAALTLAVTASCDDDDDIFGSPGPDGCSTLTVAWHGGTLVVGSDVLFSPLSPTPPAQSVTMQPCGVAGDIVSICIQVTQVTGFFGTGFHVVFQPASAVYVSNDSSRSFLREDGVGTFFTATIVSPGDLAVSATRLQNSAGTVQGVNVESGSLIVLNFRATASTAGNIFSFGPPREVCAD